MSMRSRLSRRGLWYFDLLEVYEEICRGSDWCCVNPEGMKVLVEYLEEA